MYSKSGPKMPDDSKLRGRRPLSIALRMTIWYALSAFTLIFLATGFLYWVLATNLVREDDRTLADSLDNLRLLAHAFLSGTPAVHSELPLAWPRRQQMPQSYFRILDGSGRILVETPGLSDEILPPAGAELAAITTAPVGSEVMSRSGRQFQVLSARVGGTIPRDPVRVVQVAIDRANDDDLLTRYRQRLLLILGFSVVLCSLVGYAIARSGMRPIESIGHTAEYIRSTTLHERIGTLGLPAELSGLAGTFNSMLDRLQESFARISQFSDDAAHELRTPINNLRGEIEVALTKARSSEDYREILGSCLEECARISRVIQSLLFLARAENIPERLQRENIDVGKELAAVQEFYEAAAVEAGVDLSVSVTADLWAPLDRTLFQQAVGNLVSNAIAHTQMGGMVQVTACGDESWLQVRVMDTGCGIAREHLPHVLDRFYRVDRARSGSRNSVGLGLAVVKSIVERHSGTIEIDSEIERGTQAKLIFPRQV